MIISPLTAVSFSPPPGFGNFFLNWKILSAIWAREEGPCVTWDNELLEFSLQLDPTAPLRIRPWVVSPLWTFTALTFRNWVRAVQTGYFPAASISRQNLVIVLKFWANFHILSHLLQIVSYLHNADVIMPWFEFQTNKT